MPVSFVICPSSSVLCTYAFPAFSEPNQAVRARLADGETELRHMRDMLETARSAASAAQDLADQCQKEAAVAEVGGTARVDADGNARMMHGLCSFSQS